MASREIKFRAWDGDAMYSDVGVLPSNGSIRFGTHDGHMSYRPNEAELMQYTGLKDKNGVEIYEGDILSRQYPTSSQPKNYSVKWVENMNGIGFNLRPQGSKTMKSLEVIGNIYENPELLK